MVQPVQHGYADYGRYRALADILQIDDINVPVVGSKTYGSRFVGLTNSLFVFGRVNAFALRVSITFYADQALTISLDTYQMDCDNVSTIRQPIRVLGPYMQAVANIAGGGTAAITLQVWNTDGMGFAHAVGRDPSLISQNQTAINAGATTTFTCPYVRAGELSWSGHSNAAAWSAKVQAVDFNGTTYDLDQIDNSIGAVWNSRRIFAPAANVQVVVHNGDAGAKNFDIWLSRQLLTG